MTKEQLRVALEKYLVENTPIDDTTHLMVDDMVVVASVSDISDPSGSGYRLLVFPDGARIHTIVGLLEIGSDLATQCGCGDHD